jgi:hypothetical protein
MCISIARSLSGIASFSAVCTVRWVAILGCAWEFVDDGKRWVHIVDRLMEEGGVSDRRRLRRGVDRWKFGTKGLSVGR